jgi:hypothetical protein
VLGAFSSLLLLGVAATPVASLWFGGVSGLDPELARLASGAALFGLLWPLSQSLQSWFQGELVHLRRTRFVTEAMGVFFLTVSALFYLGVSASGWRGAEFAVLALVLASLCQTAWLALRSRAARRHAVRELGLPPG